MIGGGGCKVRPLGGVQRRQDAPEKRIASRETGLVLQFRSHDKRPDCETWNPKRVILLGGLSFFGVRANLAGAMPKTKQKPPKRRKPTDSSGGGDRENPETAKQLELKIQGLKYFKMIAPLLEHLRDEGSQRDKAGNRTLHYDQYCMLVMLYVLNPTVSSLRALSQASELTKVQSKLDNEKASLGSLSEASRLFAAEQLQGVITALASKASATNHDAQLGSWADKLTAVDGSIVSALPDMIQASLLNQTTGSGLVQWRLHTHFEVNNLVPRRIDVTPNAGGASDERAVMQSVVEEDRLYIMDRGYAKFALFNHIVKSQSSYVCRLRDNTVYEAVEQRELTDGDYAADVLSDQVVLLGKTSKNSDRPDHAIRIVEIRCTPHQNRTGGKAKGSTAPNSDGILRLATNLLDVPAEIIALMYSYRWAVEIFFRFYKQLMGGAHLISHSDNGIKLQVYCSMIVCLLINLWTSEKPNKRTFEMISYYFQGLASEEELVAHIEKQKRAAEAKRMKAENAKKIG